MSTGSAILTNIALSLADWPTWAIYSLTGAAFGAVGGALGSLLKTRAKWLVVVPAVIGVAVSRPITDQVIIPFIFDVKINEGLPKKLDELTTIDHISFSNHQYVYSYEIEADTPSLDFVAFKAAQLPSMCPLWAERFKSGDVVSAEYRYTFKGGVGGFIVSPADCR